MQHRSKTRPQGLAASALVGVLVGLTGWLGFHEFPANRTPVEKPLAADRLLAPSSAAPAPAQAQTAPHAATP